MQSSIINVFESRPSSGCWWKSRSRRWEVDAAWGPALRWFAPTVKGDRDLLEVPRGLQVDWLTYMPDLGGTWNLDRGQHHHLRLGLMSAMATLTYRLELGAVHFEVSGGTNLLNHTARGGIGVSF